MRLLRLKTVLAATDLEPSSDSAVQSAMRLAQAAGAKLHIAYVSPNGAGGGDPGHPPEPPALTAFRERVLSKREDRIHVRSGDPAPTLSKLTNEIGADVIVIGRHRQRAREPGASIGSTAYDVTTRSVVPCLITSRSLKVPIGKTLVAVDSSDTARGALLVALSWSSALRPAKSKTSTTTLTALHVESGRKLSAHGAHRRRVVDHELDVLKRGAGSWAGVSVTGATETSDDPVGAIVQFANDQKPDLLVLGTRGLAEKTKSGLGSVSSAVTNQIDIPVLLVPPAVWRNYATDIDYL